MENLLLEAVLWAHRNTVCSYALQC